MLNNLVEIRTQHLVNGKKSKKKYITFLKIKKI